MVDRVAEEVFGYHEVEYGVAKELQPLVVIERVYLGVDLDASARQIFRDLIRIDRALRENGIKGVFPHPPVSGTVLRSLTLVDIALVRERLDQPQLVLEGVVELLFDICHVLGAILVVPVHEAL